MAVVDIARVEDYLKKNCTDTIWIAKKYLPKPMVREYIILKRFGDWDNYQRFLSQLKDEPAHRVEKIVDSFLNLDPDEVKFSVRYDTEKIETNLQSKVDSTKGVFRDYLFQLIKEKNISEVELYKKAHLDKRLFSKIRKSKFNIPSKQTLFAIAFALELNVQETNELLQHGGYFLSKARKEDVIVQYFIENNIFDLFALNEVLFHFDCPIVGGY